MANIVMVIIISVIIVIIVTIVTIVTIVIIAMIVMTVIIVIMIVVIIVVMIVIIIVYARSLDCCHYRRHCHCNDCRHDLIIIAIMITKSQNVRKNPQNQQLNVEKIIFNLCLSPLQAGWAITHLNINTSHKKVQWHLRNGVRKMAHFH